MATIRFNWSDVIKLKILFMWMLIACFQLNPAYAQTPSISHEPIEFVYIHGTNNNSETAKRNFIQSSQRLHLLLKQNLDGSPLFHQLTLANGFYSISPKPDAFFWGDRTRPALDVIQQQLLITRLLSPKFVQRLRQEIALTLHDAVWFEQTQNKKAVLALLYTNIMKETEPPHNIVLMGHSAGSMIAFEFMLYRVPYIDIPRLMKVVSAPEELTDEAIALNLQPTCLEALEQGNIFRFNATGNLVPFLRDVEFPYKAPEDETAFKTHYFRDRLIKLDEYTNNVCLPRNSLKGVILFGSPLTLFTSSIFTPPADQNYFVGQLGKYFLENDKFWLHINHVKDPIAFPIREKDVLERLRKAAQEDITPSGGFIVNYWADKPGAKLRSAHSWYWNKPDLFSQSILEAYQQGYQQWYH